jgi:hypothetical protein
MWVVRDVSTLDDAVVAIIAVKQSDNVSGTRHRRCNQLILIR